MRGLLKTALACVLVVFSAAAVAQQPALLGRCNVPFVVAQFKSQFTQVKIKQIRSNSKERFCKAIALQNGERITITYRMTTAADDFSVFSHDHKPHDHKH